MKRNNDETLESPARSIYRKYILKGINQAIKSGTFLYKCGNYSREETIK